MIETLEKQHMDAVKEMAKVNLEISANKEKLSKMKANIQEFLDLRDEQDRVRFDKFLKDSKDLVSEIGKNHAKVALFYKEIKSYSGFLNEFCINVNSGFSQLNKEYTDFTELVESEMLKLSEIRKENELMIKSIALEKKDIENVKKEIEKEKLHIESQRASLKNSYEAEKKLFDKLNK